MVGDDAHGPLLTTRKLPPEPAYDAPATVPRPLVLSLCSLGAACAPLTGCMPGGNIASHLATPPKYEPTDQAKCGVRKSADHPLIVEWPSADRATLEAKAQAGLVAVRYVGCEMEVLHRCKLPGKYGYTAITPKHDAVTIKDSDELYANMPVGAAKLEGTLEKSGQLQVSMTIVGRYEADRASFTPEQLDGADCERATHVVSGMTTGAFELSAGGSATVGGGASAFGAGAGGKSTASRETLERDGHEEKCEAGSARAGEPPDGCGAVLRLDLVPLEAPKKKVRVAEEGEADTVAPGLYADGNLRVAAFCAERTTPLMPQDGLRVVLDGKKEPEKPLHPNFVITMGTQTVNNRAVPFVMQDVTDVGFIVPAGPHHLSIEAPDCAPVETDVKLSATHATNVTADMEVAAETLKGPAGAPAGYAWLIGGYGMQIPRSLLYQQQVIGVDGSPFGGAGLLGFTYEHRYFTFGALYGVGAGSFSGQVKNNTPQSGESGGPFPFSGSQFQNMVDIRAGVRLPLRYVALMAGSGIGGSMWIGSYHVDTSRLPSTTIADVTLEGGVNLLWHLPLWAAVDLKPFCDWGVQLGGAYNVQPTDMNGSYAMLSASLLWQPSPSCARTAGVSVSP
jgi:hypothetical protein